MKMKFPNKKCNFTVALTAVCALFAAQLIPVSAHNVTTTEPTISEAALNVTNLTPELFEPLDIVSADVLASVIEVKSKPAEEMLVKPGEDLSLSIVLKMLTPNRIRDAMVLTAHKGSKVQEMYMCKEIHGAMSMAKVRRSFPPARMYHNRSLDCECSICGRQTKVKAARNIGKERLCSRKKQYVVSTEKYTKVEMVVYNIAKPDNDTTFSFDVGNVTVFRTTVIVRTKKALYEHDRKKKHHKMEARVTAGIVVACVVMATLLAITVMKLLKPKPSAAPPTRTAASSTQATQTQMSIDKPPAYND